MGGGGCTWRFVLDIFFTLYAIGLYNIYIYGVKLLYITYKYQYDG